MLHHVRDMILHDSKRFLACPVLVVSLTTIRGNPRRRLLIPHETVPTQHHLLVLGKGGELVSGKEIEATVLATEGLWLHLVLSNQHVELPCHHLCLG